METEIANNKRYINAIQTVYPYEFKSVSNDNLKIEVTEYKSHGGFGITYLGNYHSREGNKKPFNTQKVIIKEFFMDMGNSGKCIRSTNGETVVFADNIENIQYFQKKFEKESDILSKLSHPNIVNVLHDFKANNTSYFVMEHIEGVTLREYIEKNGPFKSFNKAWKYMAPLCEGLKEVHEKGIIHCDISPNNIMVETKSNGKDIKRLVLIDFGGCRSYNINEKEGADLSRVSLMTYTDSYSSLELTNLQLYNDTYEDAQATSIKASADIYSIGATLYFIMTGTHPQNCYKTLKKELGFPNHFDFKLSNVIKVTMQPKKEDRPQTIGQLINLCIDALEKESDTLNKQIEEYKMQISKLDNLVYKTIMSDDGKEHKIKYKQCYEDEVKNKNEMEKTLNEKISIIQKENLSLKEELTPKGDWFSFNLFAAIIIIQLSISAIITIQLIEFVNFNFILETWDYIGIISFSIFTLFVCGVFMYQILESLKWNSWDIYLNFLKKNITNNYLYSYKLHLKECEEVRKYNRNIDITNKVYQFIILVVFTYSAMLFSIVVIKDLFLFIKSILFN